MSVRIRCFLLLGFLLIGMGTVSALEGTTPQGHRAIPYRTDVQSLEDQSLRTMTVLVTVLVVAALGLYFLRRRMPGLSSKGKRLMVIARVNLNPRSTLYLVCLDQRELLLAQCGDSITQVNVGVSASNVSQSSEADHG